MWWYNCFRKIQNRNKTNLSFLLLLFLKLFIVLDCIAKKQPTGGATTVVYPVSVLLTLKIALFPHFVKILAVLIWDEKVWKTIYKSGLKVALILLKRFQAEEAEPNVGKSVHFTKSFQEWKTQLFRELILSLTPGIDSHLSTPQWWFCCRRWVDGWRKSMLKWTSDTSVAALFKFEYNLLFL